MLIFSSFLELQLLIIRSEGIYGLDFEYCALSRVAIIFHFFFIRICKFVGYRCKTDVWKFVCRIFTKKKNWHETERIKSNWKEWSFANSRTAAVENYDSDKRNLKQRWLRSILRRALRSIWKQTHWSQMQTLFCTKWAMKIKKTKNGR